MLPTETLSGLLNDGVGDADFAEIVQQRATCSTSPLGGANTPSGPPVKVLLGTDGTQTIPAGNTGAGVAHLTGCIYYKRVRFPGSGTTGNSGAV